MFKNTVLKKEDMPAAFFTAKSRISCARRRLLCRAPAQQPCAKKQVQALSRT